MSTVVLLNKPFGVLCQFSPAGDRATLREFVSSQAVYPAGRLDSDSEGLVVLTDDGGLQHRIANPRRKLPKTYFAQVEGIATEEALDQLQRGVRIGDHLTRPARARLVAEPQWLWPRVPPIRFRQHIPTSWIELVLTEGRNRQVRRMTAAAGFPTLRLVRFGVGPWTVSGLAPGESRTLSVDPACLGQ